MVLIVDDEPLIRWSVAESLESAGHEVVEAGSAREALACVERQPEPFTVAFVDLKLPDSSDLTLLRRLRQLLPDCRIILMTAHGTPEIMDEALRAGAAGVLNKPFDMGRAIAIARDGSRP
jgi:DNA-binding NtrC family response regulator